MISTEINSVGGEETVQQQAIMQQQESIMDPQPVVYQQPMIQQPVIVVQQPMIRSLPFTARKNHKMFGCWPTKQGLMIMFGITACWGWFCYLFSFGWMVPTGGTLCVLGALCGFVGMGKNEIKWLTAAQAVIGLATAILFAAPFVCLYERCGCEATFGPTSTQVFFFFGSLTVVGYGYIWIIVMNRYKRSIEERKWVNKCGDRY